MLNTNLDTPLVYNYQPKRWLGPLIALISAAIVLYLATHIGDSKRGMRLFKIITLDLQQTKLLLWAVATMFSGLAAFGLLIFVKSIQEPRQVLLTRDYILTPKNAYSSGMAHIKFDNISNSFVQKISNVVVLVIQHQEGETRILRGMLDDEETFKEFSTQLLLRASSK